MLFKRRPGGAKPTSTVPDAPGAVSDRAPAPPGEGVEPDVAALAQTTSIPEPQDIVYPQGLRLVLLLASILVSMFLVALDRLIIATAIPQITNDFHAVTDIGWYGSAYLLTSCAFQLMFGKLYTFFSVKAVFLVAVFLFEAGSAICGAAPNSVSFIIGRAIAGVGSAGIMSGAIVIIVYAVPLHKRPMYQGLFGAVFGISSILGPLLGGAFTTNVTWRWCFYINLPFGALAMIFIAVLLKVPDRNTTKLPLMEKILQLDLLGTSALLPGTVCLLLALQWGGSEHPWSEGRIIALLTLAGVFLVAFVVVQIYKPDTATVPPRIFTQRSIFAGFWATVCIGAQMMIFAYFLPVWFQAIKGVSAMDSGIHLLPMVLPMVAASIVAGGLTTHIGYYTPIMLVGSIFMAVGAGLLTTFQVDTEDAKWVGYQVLYGWSLGMMFQAPNIAAQTVLPLADVPIGTSLMFFGQLLGGAIFISVGQNVLNNQLVERLSPLPGFNPRLLLENGATTLITKLPEDLKDNVLFEYNEALRKVFQVGLVMTCLCIFGALAMEWKSVKQNKQKKPEADAAEKGEVKKGEVGNKAVVEGARKDSAGEEGEEMIDDAKDEVREVRVDDVNRTKQESEKRGATQGNGEKNDAATK